MKPANFPGRKEARRQSAKERQERRQKRSSKEQLKILEKRTGASAQERKRLINEQNEKK